MEDFTRNFVATMVLVTIWNFACLPHWEEEECYPQVRDDEGTPNYVIAYGSLLNSDSRERTLGVSSSTACDPVRVQGYERSWSAAASNSTETYLGVRPNTLATMATLACQVYPTKIKFLDKRESLYCRVKVAHSQLEFAVGLTPVSPKAAVWIYVTRPRYLWKGSLQREKKRYVSSRYASLFVDGCIEAALAHQGHDIAGSCRDDTRGWEMIPEKVQLKAIETLDSFAGQPPIAVETQN